jgi:hypothetical protein
MGRSGDKAGDPFPASAGCFAPVSVIAADHAMSPN